MARSLKKSYLHKIYVYAQVDDSHLDGGEIITKQVRGRGYKVVSTHAPDGAICNLVATDSPAAGEMFTLAQDSDGNTYYITKLTRHKATLVQKEQIDTPPFQFANGSDQAVKHNFGDSAVAGQSVQLILYND